MTVQMNAGKQLVSQVDQPPASIHNAMSGEELHAKWDSLAAPTIGDKRSAQRAEMVKNIERCDDVRRVMRLTVPAARR
jgi:hypothetical protein